MLKIECDYFYQNYLQIRRPSQLGRSGVSFILRYAAIVSLIFFFYPIILSSQIPKDSLKISQADSTIISNSGIEDDSVEATSNNNLIYDTSSTESRNFDTQKINEFHNDKDFYYSGITVPKFDLWEFLDRLFDRYVIIPLTELVGNSGASPILIVLILLISGFLIFLLIKKRLNTGLANSLSKSLVVRKNSFNDIHTLNFDKAIATALESGNYSEAVRLNFLKVLKILFESGILNYKPGSTNTDYLREIRNSNLHEAFSRLSYIFNFVSYGKFQISENDYSIISEKFSDFSNRVVNNENP